MAIAAEKCLELATAHNLQYFKELGRLSSAALQVETGKLSEGIKGLVDGLISYQNYGYGMYVPFYRLCLARAHYKAGEVQEGLQVVEKTLSLVEVTSERLYEAELLRLKGELLLAGRQPNGVQAEANFLKSIEIARHQSAKLWELRAATSLARLWRDVGRHAEARDLLAPIYAWFTEGLDLPDLKDARALLDELGQRST